MDSQIIIDSNIVPSLLFINNLKLLLQELYNILSNMEIEKYSLIGSRFIELINNFLFEYDLNPKNVFDIMTSNSQNIIHYSSLIGYFYQHGISCEVDEIKAFEIFSNAVKNNQKALLEQFSLDQNNETITFFCNDDIKELNEIITQYFYSLFLYKDIILHRKDNYKLHIRNAEKGDNVSQLYIGNYYFYGLNYKKAFEWYSKSSEGGNIKAMYRLCRCYNDEFYGIVKDERKAFEWHIKSAEGGYGRALYELGNLYDSGIGALKDECKAFEMYLKAAEKGYYCQYSVTRYYMCVLKNLEKWFYWIRKFAIDGNVRSQYALADYYLYDPVNKNVVKAFKWCMKLANENRLRAYYLVAKCYRDGIGIDKDLEEATKWFKKYESSKTNGRPSVTLNGFLNGSNIKWNSLYVSFSKYIYIHDS
jgi:TPR repeat protein